MDPSEILLETRDDGSLRVLGSGTYGKARPLSQLLLIPSATVPGVLQRHRQAKPTQLRSINGERGGPCKMKSPV